MYLTEILSRSHEKELFDSGVVMLDNYLHKQVNQDVKRKLTVCYVLVDQNTILGYYTLSGDSIPLDAVPEELKKKLPPSYKNIPVTLLGRLAVDRNYQKKPEKWGEKLLIDALKRSYDLTTQVGSFAVIVDPINIQAQQFYEKYGFILLPDSGKMFLSMKTIEQVFIP